MHIGTILYQLGPWYILILSCISLDHDTYWYYLVSTWTIPSVIGVCNTLFSEWVMHVLNNTNINRCKFLCDQWFPVMCVSLVSLKHVEEMLTLNVSFVNYVELFQLHISRSLSATCGNFLWVFRILPSIKLKAF